MLLKGTLSRLVNAKFLILNAQSWTLVVTLLNKAVKMVSKTLSENILGGVTLQTALKNQSQLFAQCNSSTVLKEEDTTHLILVNILAWMNYLKFLKL